MIYPRPQPPFPASWGGPKKHPRKEKETGGVPRGGSRGPAPGRDLKVEPRPDLSCATSPCPQSSRGSGGGSGVSPASPGSHLPTLIPSRVSPKSPPCRSPFPLSPRVSPPTAPSVSPRCGTARRDPKPSPEPSPGIAASLRAEPGRATLNPTSASRAGPGRAVRGHRHPRFHPECPNSPSRAPRAPPLPPGVPSLHPELFLVPPSPACTLKFPFGP